MPNTKKKVAVIGAGMVGMATASYLQRDGHDVIVIEPGNPGEGASFGNAACFNASSVVPVSMPGMIYNVPRWLFDPLGPLSIRWAYLPTLMPWLVRLIRAGRADKVEATATALRSLLHSTLTDLMPIARAANAEDLVHRTGLLIVYESNEGREKAEMEWAMRKAHGVVLEELNADELRQMDPALSRKYVRGILIRENGHTNNPLRLVQRLTEAFVREGGQLVREKAVDFEFDGARLKGVRTDQQVHAADQAVITAGIWSKSLAAKLGDKVSLETERGYHIMVRDPEVMPRLPTMSGEGKFVATPMETGLRFAGTVELAGMDAPPDWRRAEILLKQGLDMFPGLARSYPEQRLSRWMGHRPGTPDSLPIIGPSRRSPDVIYAFGHGHVGMAASAPTGKLVANLVAGRQPGIDIAPFAAGRFS